MEYDTTETLDFFEYQGYDIPEYLEDVVYSMYEQGDY